MKDIYWRIRHCSGCTDLDPLGGTHSYGNIEHGPEPKKNKSTNPLVPLHKEFNGREFIKAANKVSEEWPDTSLNGRMDKTEKTLAEHLDDHYENKEPKITEFDLNVNRRLESLEAQVKALKTKPTNLELKGKIFRILYDNMDKPNITLYDMADAILELIK